MAYFQKEDSRSKGDTVRLKQIVEVASPLKLQHLSYSNNIIRTIPQHLSTARNLEMIDLSHNRISKIENLFNLKHLKLLNLSYNLISQVPSEITLLHQIQNLDLSFNKISILNNIRILKQLVRIRVCEKGGFIEVNLDGNQIMKKKSAREMVKKWLTMSSHQAPLKISKKYQKKEINQPSKYFEQSREQLSNNYILEHSERSHSKKLKESINSFHPEKNAIKDLSAIMPFKSESLFLEVNQNQSHILEDELNTKVLKLQKIFQNMMLIFESEDFNHVGDEIKRKVKEQNNLIEQMINCNFNAIDETIKRSITKNTENKLVVVSPIISDKLKKIHQSIILIFNENKELPLTLYKPWVNQYRILKEQINQIPFLINQFKKFYTRQRQLSELMSLSPQKKQNSKALKQPGSSVKKNRLNKLLFSKEKEDQQLLSSAKKQSTSKKLEERNTDQCNYCLIKKEETKRLRVQNQELISLVNSLKETLQEKQKIITELEDYKDKNIQLQKNQRQIIEELSTKITASTFQNILLTQATAIEQMISSPVKVEIQNYHTQQYGWKNNISKTKDITKSREPYSSKREKVNQFMMDSKGDKSQGRTSSYFKNKNSIKTIVNTNEGSKNHYYQDSNNAILVSQFNSQTHSLNQSKQKDNQSRNSKKSSVLKEKESLIKTQLINHPRRGEKQQTILISQQSPRPPKNFIDLRKKQELIQQLKEDNYTKVLREIQTKNNLSSKKYHNVDYLSKKNIKANQIYNKKTPNKSIIQRKKTQQKENICSQNIRRVRTVQKLDLNTLDTKGSNYIPINLTQEDRYKKFVQFHLRNNIIEVLSKKCLSHKDYNHIVKKPTYISKGSKLLQTKMQISKTDGKILKVR